MATLVDPVIIANGDDAAEFVDSVMGSQRVVRVDTPAATGSRKRPAESPSDESSVKKQKQSVKRALYDAPPTPTPAPRRSAGKTTTTCDNTVEHLIRQMSADMHMHFTSLSERVDQLESSLEQRIANKVSQLLDKRVNLELKRIYKDVDEKIDAFRESMRSDVGDELAELRAKVDQLAIPNGLPSHDDLKARNIILRGLQFSENENITDKVHHILSDGLHLYGIVCDSAERKESRNSRPGVVVVRFRNVDDKRKVMSKKRDLKNSRQYTSVFIEHDLSYADRVMSNNFRTLLRSTKNQHLSMRGSRVVPREDTGSSRFGNNGPSQSRQGSTNSVPVANRNGQGIRNDGGASGGDDVRGGGQGAGRGGGGDRARGGRGSGAWNRGGQSGRGGSSWNRGSGWGNNDHQRHHNRGNNSNY